MHLKRRLAAWVLLLFAVCGACIPAAAASDEARALPVTVQIERDGAEPEDAPALTDTSVYSSMRFDGETRLTVYGTEGLYGLSVWFDTLSAPWRLEVGGESRVCGESGMLHAFEVLPGALSCTLTVPAGTTVCEFTAYTSGPLPQTVQVWQEADTPAELLLFPTHADDEQLFFGGLMPYYAAERGRSVQLAYLVNHTSTEPYRMHELLNGLWTVGIRRYPVFSDFTDVYVENLETASAVFGADAVRDWQTAVIRRFRPLVVVGHDLEGEYGHGLHCLNAAMLTEAVPAAADPSCDPASAAQYGVHDTPKLYLHLYPERPIRLRFDEIYLSAFGGQSALEVARAGYLCHASQHHWNMSVEASGYADCGLYGLFRSTVGDDAAGDDLFEHIAAAAPAEEAADTAPVDTAPAEPAAEAVTEDTAQAETEPAEEEATLPEPKEARRTLSPGGILWLSVMLSALAAAGLGIVLDARHRTPQG